MMNIQYPFNIMPNMIISMLFLLAFFDMDSSFLINTNPSVNFIKRSSNRLWTSMFSSVNDQIVKPNVFSPNNVNKMIIGAFNSLPIQIDELKDNLLQLNITGYNAVTILNCCCRRNINPERVIQGDRLVSVLRQSKGLNCNVIARTLTVLKLISQDNAILFSDLARSLARNILDSNDKLSLEAFSLGVFSMKTYSNRPETIEVLRALCQKLSSEPIQREEITEKIISMTFSGLCYQSSDNQVIRSILLAMKGVIDLYASPISGETVSNILYGMTQSSSEHYEVRMFVDSLCNNIESSNLSSLRSLTTKQFCRAVSGMRGFSSSHASTCRLLDIFTSLLSSYQLSNRSLNDSLVSEPSMLQPIQSPMELEMLVSGLKHLSSDHSAVIEFLNSINNLILIDRVIWAKQKWQERNIFNAYLSLQSLSSDRNITLELLSKLTNIFQVSNAQLSVRGISNALHGFQRMSADKQEVQYALRFLLKHLNTHVNGTNEGRRMSECTAFDVAMACYGLQSMSPGQSYVVKNLVQALSGLINHSSCELSNSQFALSVIGLKSMEPSYPAIKLLTNITMKWNIQTGKVVNPRDRSSFLTGSELFMIVRGLSSLGNQYFIVDKIFMSLSSHINANKDYYINLQRSGQLDNQHFRMMFHDLHSMGSRRVRGKTAPLDRLMSQSLGFGIPKIVSRNRHNVSPKLLSFIDALVDLLDHRMQRMTAADVAISLYGLQSLTAESYEINRLLKTLADDLRHSSDEMTAQNIGNALYGLQNMSSNSLEVQGLLDALGPAINRSNHVLTAQAVGNAFFGLQYMSSDYPSVRRIVEVLASKVDFMPDVVYDNQSGLLRNEEYMLTGQHIGNALWGLRNMTSNHPEVRHALISLSRRIKISSSSMNGQNIGNALYAFQSMTNDNDEVKEALTALAHKIVWCEDTISSVDAAMALYGLRSMDQSSVEVRVILGALLHKIQNSDIQFQLPQLSQAIMGIISSVRWVRDDFLKVLASKVPGMSYVNFGDPIDEL